MHVVAAVIYDKQHRVLLSQRLAGRHRAGYWEFPGGKVARGEQAERALGRELEEELGIVVQQCRPLIQVLHAYEQHTVLLDVWQVSSFQGEAVGKEGQALQWCHVDELSTMKMPEADLPVLKAISLPNYYVITDEPSVGLNTFLDEQAQKFAAGAKLLQFRAKTLTRPLFKQYAQALIALAADYRAQVLLNTDVSMASDLGAQGLHLTEKRLLNIHDRDVLDGFIVGASCHSVESLQHAEALGVDFAVLSPVKKTLSHPEAEPLGWQGFADMVKAVNIPVYALGGMGFSDIARAQNAGGQGVAGIGMFANPGSSPFPAE